MTADVGLNGRGSGEATWTANVAKGHVASAMTRSCVHALSRRQVVLLWSHRTFYTVSSSDSLAILAHGGRAGASNTKMPVYGDNLVQHINKDEALRSKLMESTMNTVWLHYGLLNAGLAR